MSMKLYDYRLKGYSLAMKVMMIVKIISINSESHKQIFPKIAEDNISKVKRLLLIILGIFRRIIRRK